MGSKDTHDSDVAFIRALAELLRENDLTEIEVHRDYGEDDALNVRIGRGAPAPVYAAPLAMPTPPQTPGTPVPPAAPAVASSAPADLSAHPGAVTSPMVGTVYLQPEPGSPAFAPVGTVVQEGDTLLIIEAMKTMNQIPAPRAGTVKRVLVDDGSPVEYGAPLLIIE